MTTAVYIGYDGEVGVGSLLMKQGRKVIHTFNPCPYDLLVDGMRVEVKTSRFHKGRWSFNIRWLNEFEIDWYVFRLEEVPDTNSVVHLLLKAPLGRTHIQITPTVLRDRWTKHIHDFEEFASGKVPECLPYAERPI